jgi:Mg-chelatase subunit ChlD
LIILIYFQVGLLQYSSYGRRTKVAFTLDEFNSKAGLEDAIKQLKWTKGGTKTGYALKKAQKRLLRNARKGVKNIVIVLTDGRSSDNVKVKFKSGIFFRACG